MIAGHLIEPSDIPVSWADIAGLEDVIQELRETVILPIQKKDLFADSQLTQPPKGIATFISTGTATTKTATPTLTPLTFDGKQWAGAGKQVSIQLVCAQIGFLVVY